MKELLNLTVYGHPVPQGRGRASSHVQYVPGPGGRPKAVARTHVYDPAESRDWKGDVKLQIMQHYRPPTLTTAALALDLRFMLQRPKSLPKRVKHHGRKPDLDNLEKAVKDAMKGVVYVDDGQVDLVRKSKGWAKDVPGVRIRVWELEEGDEP